MQSGYRFALCLTHHNAQAEDLVQDAWFAVLRAGKPLSRAYLFTTIRNRFIDLYRRTKGLAFEPLTEQVAPQEDDPWEDERIFPNNGRLEEALASLRPQERAALFLSAVEGYTCRQIGELMDWPRGTVLSHIHRARIKLRRMLESESG